MKIVKMYTETGGSTRDVNVPDRFLTVSNIYSMFIEPTITWVSSFGVLWVHMAGHKNCVKKKMWMAQVDGKCWNVSSRWFMTPHHCVASRSCVDGL